jgi:hypothetical protein
VPVRLCEITEHAGRWSGHCIARSIYSTSWNIKCVTPRYRPLMEAQVMIDLAGPISEAIHRGERDVLRFAESHCEMAVDLDHANAVLKDIFIVVGRNERQRLAERTLALLTTHWRAVEALADALIEHGRIEGSEVTRIVFARARSVATTRRTF